MKKQNIFLITVLLILPLLAGAEVGPGDKRALMRLVSRTKPAATRMVVPKNAANAIVKKKPVSIVETGRQLDMAMSNSSFKQLLNRRQAFQHEINLMTDILPRVQNLQVAASPSDLAWVELLIKDNVINKTLSKSLLNLLEEKDFNQMATEIANYYGIPQERNLHTLSKKDLRETVAQTALDYALTHPHKPNLPLRELLKSWKVAERTKEHIRRYLAVPEILYNDMDGFKRFVRDAYNQHQKGLRQAANAPEVQQSVIMYQNALKDLRAFVEKNKRQPIWNSPAKERRLYNTLQLILIHNKTNTFLETETIKREIRQLLDQYPNRPLWQFLEDLENFVAQHKRYPESISERPNSSLHERMLYDEMVHFMTEGTLSLKPVAK